MLLEMFQQVFKKGNFFIVSKFSNKTTAIRQTSAVLKDLQRDMSGFRISNAFDTWYRHMNLEFQDVFS